MLFVSENVKVYSMLLYFPESVFVIKNPIILESGFGTGVCSYLYILYSIFSIVFYLNNGIKTVSPGLSAPVCIGIHPTKVLLAVVVPATNKADSTLKTGLEPSPLI